MKTFLGMATVAFFVVLAIIVGYRMNAEAMAVVIGVICGVVASIPMSGLILLITGRQRRQASVAPPMPHWEPYRESPPVVVIQGGSPVQQTPSWPAYGQLAAPNVSRDFRVVGGQWIDERREVSYENGPAMVR